MRPIFSQQSTSRPTDDAVEFLARDYPTQPSGAIQERSGNISTDFVMRYRKESQIKMRAGPAAAIFHGGVSRFLAPKKLAQGGKDECS